MRDRSRPLGYAQERHRRKAMERLAEAKRRLEQVEAEARLLATKRVTSDAVNERALLMVAEIRAAMLAVVEAQNELLMMKSAAADEEDEKG